MKKTTKNNKLVNKTRKIKTRKIKTRKIVRTHNTNDKNLVKNFKYINYDQPTAFLKPNGFWYEINNSIKKWGEMDFGKGGYKVKVLFGDKLLTRDLNVNKYTNKILLLDNLNDIVHFIKLYSIKKKYKIPANLSFNNNDTKGNSRYETYNYIKWYKVAKYYAGIELRNFNKLKPQIKLKIKNCDWYYSFDFDSGCIWDLKNLEKFIKIYKNEK
jgi:hypothetical protein